MPQIYDMGPTALLPLRREACRGFFHSKNPTALAGFEPANLGTKGQHATPRPPKAVCQYNNHHKISQWNEVEQLLPQQLYLAWVQCQQRKLMIS